ncbi:RNA polymerase sigma factor [Pirellulaceae bacterium SH449]
MNSRPNDDDTNLVPTIERIREGDSDAFQWIYDHFIASVRRRCRKRLCREDQCLQIEDDIANEIMASLWLALRTSNKRWSTLSQLNSIVHRMIVERCIDRARYIKRKKRSLSEDLSALFDALYACRIPWYDMRELETLSMIRELMDLLACHDLKDWVSLRWQGYSNAEIALTWGTSTRTAERKMQAVGNCFRTKWPQVG